MTIRNDTEMVDLRLGIHGLRLVGGKMAPRDAHRPRFLADRSRKYGMVLA